MTALPSLPHLCICSGPLLDINDLQYVLDTLNEAGFPQEGWNPLGRALGLHGFSTLKAIEDDYPGDVQECLRQCLVKWLERADSVDYEGGPRMFSLFAALKDIRTKVAADYIRKNIIDKDSPELRHYREALKTIVRCHLTKAVVQGEARVGSEVHLICSTVSSKVLRSIAKVEGIQFSETLTGFSGWVT
uniref:Death domain-containing protein n=1 Tax=Amphimedon queenslandica TaxID=400682 RepID=A0A1X7THT2_AMPQE